MPGSANRARRLLTAVFGILLSGASTFVESGNVVTPGSKAENLEACVAPSEEMRRYHMIYLKHERIGTVREGVRGGKHSLVECVDCHGARDGQGQAISIIDEGQFCQQCHGYMAVNIDCFQCHRKVPRED